MYLLTLPFPPSVNNYYGHLARGKTVIKYVKPKGKEYKKTVKEYVAKNNLQLKANIPLKVSIVLTPKDNRKHDIDNVLKALFDSLTEADFWQDDSLVRELNITYQPPQDPGSVLIHVEPL